MMLQKEGFKTKIMRINWDQLPWNPPGVSFNFFGENYKWNSKGPEIARYETQVGHVWNHEKTIRWIRLTLATNPAERLSVALTKWAFGFRIRGLDSPVFNFQMFQTWCFRNTKCDTAKQERTFPCLFLFCFASGKNDKLLLLHGLILEWCGIGYNGCLFDHRCTDSARTFLQGHFFFWLTSEEPSF